MLRINIRAAATYFSSCCKKVTQIHPHLFTASRNHGIEKGIFSYGSSLVTTQLPTHPMVSKDLIAQGNNMDFLG